MKNLSIILTSVFLMFGCVNPASNPDNPDLRVINDLENYKISEIKFNNQLFTGLGEYLMPGEQTEYMKVEASAHVMLSYRWENVNNASDNGETGTMFTEGDFEGFQEKQTYNIVITGDKSLPTLYVYQL
ncbi:hypothetical protein JW879_09550 [candidate division WOR-3 bacterium]|nr:hypothetical protein [candidate division WOR-3 bacterium]